MGVPADSQWVWIPKDMNPRCNISHTQNETRWYLPTFICSSSFSLSVSSMGLSVAAAASLSLCSRSLCSRSRRSRLSRYSRSYASSVHVNTHTRRLICTSVHRSWNQTQRTRLRQHCLNVSRQLCIDCITDHVLAPHTCSTIRARNWG